jgi:hypothetical protein
MKNFYILIVTLVAGFHIFAAFDEKTVSPLNFNLILLLLIPFLIYVWKDAASIKFGSKGLELEKLKKDVDNTIKHAVQGESIDHKSLETLFKSVEANDWLKLVLARMLMRKGLVDLVPVHNLGPSPSLNKLIPMCLESGKISTQERESLEKLRNITFYAEWWAGDTPTHEEWKWAIENSPNIIQNLFDKQPIA